VGGGDGGTCKAHKSKQGQARIPKASYPEKKQEIRNNEQQVIHEQQVIYIHLVSIE
jgi:hypothetical protein